MNFVQEFSISEDICNFILSNLSIEESVDRACISADIPEIKEPLIKIAREYFTSIEEYNYFGFIHKMTYEIGNVFIRYLPSWRYQMYEASSDGTLNFFIFLKDNDSVFEVFNPFIRSSFRVRPRKGLVVIFPAIWMMIYRHTDTLTKDSIFISGSLGVDNLDNMQQP